MQPGPTLEELLREEGELELLALSESDAYELGTSAVPRGSSSSR